MLGSRCVQGSMLCLAELLTTACLGQPSAVVGAERFEGRFYVGEGDVEYLSLLDISWRMFGPDPDVTRHGVYGAAKHGYFWAVVNHDAICFRVVDDRQAEKIYQKIAAIPGLRRYDLIITNCPGLYDTYVDPVGLWEFGRWVNGGHWSTCEARISRGRVPGARVVSSAVHPWVRFAIRGRTHSQDFKDAESTFPSESQH